MKSPQSGTAIALSVALLVPMVATAQEAMTRVVRLPDATGDLHDLDTGEPLEGPAYMDITTVDVSVDSDELTVRFDVAENVPEAPDSLRPNVGYYLNIDTDGDDLLNAWVAIVSVDGWTAAVFDLDELETTYTGDAVVFGNSLSATVPVSLLGSAADMRVHGLMQTNHLPVDDSVAFIEWEDRIPDGDGEWMALGEAGPAVVEDPSTSPEAG